MKTIKLKNIYLILFIILITTFSLRRFFQPGLPSTHDGEAHLTRISSFYLSFRDGHIPARWASNLNFKYGYPLFNFSYPLAYYISLPFYILSNQSYLAFKLTIYFLTLFGSIFSYLWFRQHFDNFTALLGSFLYVLSPPYLTQIYIRGTFGEISSWMIFPILLYFIKKYSQNYYQKSSNIYLSFIVTSLAASLFTLSHNMISLMGFLFISAYILAIILNQNKPNRNQQILTLFSPILVGILLASFYWIPMVFEMKHTIVKDVGLSNNYQQHFINISELVIRKDNHHLLNIGFKNSLLTVELGYLPILLALFLIIRLISDYLFSKPINKKCPNRDYLLLIVSLLFLLSVFIMTSASSIFWHNLSLLKLFQFPWRFIFLSSFTLSIISAYYIKNLNSQIKGLILFLILANAFIYTQAPNSFSPHPENIYLEFDGTSSLDNELLSPNFHYDKNSEYKQQLKDLAGYAHFDINTWKTAYHHYQVESTQSAHIVEHVMYFPGWKTFANDKPSDIIYDHPDYPGIITFKLPAGSHTIITKFTNDTPARRLGNSISLLTFSLMVILFILQKLKLIKLKDQNEK